VIIIALFVPVSPAISITPGTASLGTAIIARSGTSPISLIDLKAFIPSTVSAL
jgi:hypothetical protein